MRLIWATTTWLRTACPCFTNSKIQNSFSCSLSTFLTTILDLKQLPCLLLWWEVLLNLTLLLPNWTTKAWMTSKTFSEPQIWDFRNLSYTITTLELRAFRNCCSVWKQITVSSILTWAAILCQMISTSLKWCSISFSETKFLKCWICQGAESKKRQLRLLEEDSEATETSKSWISEPIP